MDNILLALRAHIKRTSSVPEFADKCGVGAPTVYGWLNGNRRIRHAAAAKIEEITNRKFKKEKLIFAQRQPKT